ncbi:MAG: hypothetical protein A2W33_05005 [Chloroflexi bacterium RBG_16_52_11]|nr:MAG: hypothetical protein A2W33_05005 [Chloroflexi bacterium RBG_16_52_11]
MLALSLALATCQPLNPIISTSTPTDPIHPTLQESITPLSTRSTPAKGEPSSASQTASPSPTNQTPPAKPVPLATITSANIAGLAEIAQVNFNPWAFVLAVAWSPDVLMIAVSSGNDVILYMAETMKERFHWELGATTGSLSFSPDSRLLAAGSRDGQVRIWEVSSGKLIHAIEAHKKGVNRVTFHPDGTMLASGGNDAMARLWDVGSGEMLMQMIGGTYAIPSLAFTQDGNNLAIANGNVIRLRDVATGRFVQTIRAQEGIYSLAVSPDEATILSGGVTGALELWEIASGNASFNLEDPGLSPGSPPLLIWSVVFSPDGRLLVVASSDALIRIWEARTGELLVTLPGHEKSVTSVAFSPDGRMLASGGLDGTLRLWGIR